MDIDTVNLKVTNPVMCEQNVLKNPDGSVDYSEGDTKVLVAVYGPADCRESRQLTDRCHVEVSFRPKNGIPGVAEKFHENIIRNVCESVILTHLHPRCQIVIVVQILQDRGSLLSCAINAVSMALQDAGISMKCVPAAITLSIEKQEEGSEAKHRNVTITPSKEIEECSRALLLFVFDSVSKGIICTNCKGTLMPSLYKRCLITAKDSCETIFNFYRESVARKLTTNIELALVTQ